MYTKYYGLQAQPFRLTPDPYFFFTSATHKSALAYLRYGMKLGEGFIVVTGAAGTGKTTLSLALLGSLARDEMVVGELVTTHLQDEDLLRSIAAAFKLSAAGAKSDLIFRLQGFFTRHAQAGKHVLLVVDEAHNLPQSSFEELRMLSNFHRGSQALLQCILLGQPPLRDMLAQTGMEQFQQRVIATHHLHPLSPTETRGYILHRLQQAGWRGDPGFTAEAVRLVHQYTQGIPRLINALCNRLMLYGYIEEKHQIDATATIQVYNEWEQEFGHMGSVEPLRQPQLEEINFAGITQKHVTLDRAVGAYAPACRAAPAARPKATLAARPAAPVPASAHTTATDVRRNAAIASPQSGAPLALSISPPRDAPPQPTFTERITDAIVRLISASGSPSTPFSSPLSQKSALLLPLTASVVVLVIGAMILPVNNPEPKLLAKIATPPSPKTAATAPAQPKTMAAHKLKATAPAADPSLLSAAPLQSQQPAPEQVATPGTDANDTLPVTSTAAIEIAQRTHDIPAGHIPRIVMPETEFAALIPQPQPEAKSPPQPVAQQSHAVQAPQVSATEVAARAPASPVKVPLKTEAHAAPATVISPKKTKPQQIEIAPPPGLAAAVAVATVNSQQQPSTSSEHPLQTTSEITEAPKALPISEDELSTLLARFRGAYDSGDMNALMQLFASDARGDDDDDRASITHSYQKLFNVTDERSLALKDLHWRSVGDTVQGEGQFVATVKDKGRNWTSSYVGTINLRIEKRDGQVLITALRHSYIR